MTNTSKQNQKIAKKDSESRVFSLLHSAADPKSLEAARFFLKNGAVIGVPTETVYGLAGDALNPEAIAKIFKAKGRPSFNPLICHVSDIAMAKDYVHVSPLAEQLMQHFWPGPLSFVLPLKKPSPLSKAVTAGLDSLAVRCPAEPHTRALIKMLARPIAAPSANPSGKLSPTNALDVLEGLGGENSLLAMVLDAGPCLYGIESTIITLSSSKSEMRSSEAAPASEGEKIIILRPGSITMQDFAKITAQPVALHTHETSPKDITAPGQLLSHYAPSAPVRLEAQAKRDNEFLLGFGPIACDLNLSPSGDLAEAARHLFAYLRLADQKKPKAIAVTPIPHEGIGLALNDRLKRAAAPRPKFE